MYLCRGERVGNEGILERDFLAGCTVRIEMPGALVADNRDFRGIHETYRSYDSSFREYAGRTLDSAGIDFVDIHVRRDGAGGCRGDNDILGTVCGVYELDTRVDRIYPSVRVYVTVDDIYRVSESEAIE